MTIRFAWLRAAVADRRLRDGRNRRPEKRRRTQQKLQAFLELARGYLEKRDYVNAKRPLEQALKVDPTSAEAHVLMASVYIADGDTQLAEREYKDALRNEPRNAMAQNNYGTFLFGRGALQGSGAASEDRRERSVVRAARAGIRKPRADAAQARINRPTPNSRFCAR